MTTTYWEHFHHQADIGVRGSGNTKAEAFAQAALALTAVITNVDSVSPVDKIELDCEAPDDELLLVEWLNALVYEMATRHMLFSRFHVDIGQGRLHATVWGEKLDPQKHQPAVEIKGATYTELKVGQREDNSWCAQTVVDV